jgi:arsenate reductase
MDQRFDHVVMVCDNAARDCPFFPGGRNYVHHAFKDPAECEGTEEEILDCFRLCRDDIRRWIEEIFIKNRKIT